MELTVDQALRQAIEEHKAGKMQDAQQLYQAILRFQPGHPVANHNLGVLALECGRLDSAFTHLKAALEACPGNAQFWISYIDALIKANRPDAALNVLKQGKAMGLSGDAVSMIEHQLGKLNVSRKGNRKSIKILSEPIMPVSQNRSKEEVDKLLRNYNAGQFDIAEEIAVSFTQQFPDNPFGWKAVGVILLKTGRVQESVGPLQRACRLSANDAEAYSNLGAALKDLGRFSEAQDNFRKAIRINPEHAEAHNNLGVTLKDLERLSEAEACYRIAIRIKPDYAEAYTNLGNALRGMGQNTEAEVSHLEAIRINPNLADAHHNIGILLCDLGRKQEGEFHFRRAIEINPKNAEFYRSLGEISVYDKVDDPQFIELRKLMDLQDIDKTQVYFALGKACEDVSKYEEAYDLYIKGNTLRKEQLCYSINQDRALFQKIRSTFSNISRPEPVSFDIKTQPILIVGMPRSGTSLVEQILASHTMVYGAGELSTLGRSAARHYLNVNEGDHTDVVQTIAKEYFEAMEELSGGKPYITDKMPQNFLWVGHVLLANPDVRIVHTIRDPMATCWSIFRKYFPSKGLGFAYDLHDLVEYYKLYQDLMAFWHEKFPGRIHDLEYEKLTEDQEEETRKLLDYCGLPWEEACLNFHETERAVKTASAGQVRNKMYKGSSEAWKKFERHLGPLKAGLGVL